MKNDLGHLLIGQHDGLALDRRVWLDLARGEMRVSQ